MCSGARPTDKGTRPARSSAAAPLDASLAYVVSSYNLFFDPGKVPTENTKFSEKSTLSVT